MSGWARSLIAGFLFLLLAALLIALWLGAPAKATSAAEAAGVPSGKWILISIPQKTLTLYEGMELQKTFVVATGAYETPTPIGRFHITGRFAGEMSGFGTRFLGINVPWGQFGIHGTNKPGSIGSNASHGCVRMFVKDAQALYAAVPNGVTVVIEGGPYGYLEGSLRPLNAGDRNNHVIAVQNKLRALGYYTGSSDGIYGQGTQNAVRNARKALGLPEGQNVDYAFYKAIGLILFE